MSLVILLTVGQLVHMNFRRWLLATHFPVWLSMARKAFPLKSKYETQTSVDGMSDWNKDNTLPNTSIKHPPCVKYGSWANSLEWPKRVPWSLCLWSSQWVGGGKSTMHVLIFRVRKILNLKKKDNTGPSAVSEDAQGSSWDEGSQTRVWMPRKSHTRRRAF